MAPPHTPAPCPSGLLHSRAWRPIAAVLLALGLLPGTVLRDSPPRPHHDGIYTLTRLRVPARAAALLGPFRLVAAWHIASADDLFGGWSALLPRPGGRLLAISDRGDWFEFPEPGSAPRQPAQPPRMGQVEGPLPGRNPGQDIEAATQDQQGHIWLSWEDMRQISRFAPGWRGERRIQPDALRNWSTSFGGESLVRLPDGRFLLVSEAFQARSYDRAHQTLAFPRDPLAGDVPAQGDLIAEEGYRPTDVAALPDGRVLVLLRQLTWPLPLRFSGRIAVADPAELARTGRWHARTIARLDPPVPSDNYEGLAIRPRGDGLLDVWVISDDNKASTQRTLLLHLTVDPKKL